MPSFYDIEYDKGSIILMKGEPGTRKSTSALSYVMQDNPQPQYWFSFDQKMQALGLPAQKWGINRSLIEYDDYTSFNAMMDKLKTFKLNCKYKGGLIVDSITSMTDSMLRETIRSKVAQDPNSGKKIGSIYVPGFEEFNAEASGLVDFIDLLNDIRNYHKINIILIAHVVGQRKSDEANSSTHHSRVILTGGQKSASKIAAYMTEVYHFNIKTAMNTDDEGQYGLYTTHTGNDYARTSLPLERRILFNNEPLYPKFIKPAIDKMKVNSPAATVTTENKKTFGA
jgi:hypothetical protein